MEESNIERRFYSFTAKDDTEVRFNIDQVTRVVRSPQELVVALSDGSQIHFYDQAAIDFWNELTKRSLTLKG
jgi:hypothetical protein